MCECVCVRACVRACARACVRVCIVHGIIMVTDTGVAFYSVYISVSAYYG